MSLPSNPDPGRTLGQFGLAVLALVVLSAALFWAIDLVSDDTPATASQEASPAATPTPAATASTSATEPTSPAPTAEPTETGSAPATEATATTQPSPSVEPTEDVTSEPATTDVAPSETSLQVLDGIKDGSSRAQDIADGLAGDGYDLVAFGPSSVVYENTTVFWTTGHEEEAQALADANGWDELVENDILSESVDVHVVVGLDEQQ